MCVTDEIENGMLTSRNTLALKFPRRYQIKTSVSMIKTRALCAWYGRHPRASAIIIATPRKLTNHFAGG
jgi:hypothetical protein